MAGVVGGEVEEGGSLTGTAQAASPGWVPPLMGWTRSGGGEAGSKGDWGPVRGRLESVKTALNMPFCSRGKSKLPCLAVRSPELQASGMSLEQRAGFGGIPPATSRLAQSVRSCPLVGAILKLHSNGAAEPVTACLFCRDTLA